MSICKRIRRKLKSRLGFTLAEVLMVVLILMMVSSVVAGGVPVAANAYFKVVDAANAQMLLSTTVTKLRRELAFASDVTLESGEVKSYTNGESGQVTTLVSDDVNEDNMYAKFDKITYDKGFFIIENLQVQKTGYDNPLASVDNLRIRAIAIRDS